jgi:hypothetical protein
MELEQLLNQIAIWSNREQTIRREKYKRGESFNIFKACGVDHYEVTHSSIIAEFLNPKGSHGQGTLFVEAFIEKLKLQDFDFSLNDIVVSTEYVIPNGRFDIIIYNGDKQAIIIENKIYAQDQWMQLKKYDDYAKDKYSNGYRIVYLTLDEHLPTDEASNSVDFVPISYKFHIIDWLIQCKHLAIDKPLIRETLNQYILHLKELTETTDMDSMNQNEIIKLLISNNTTTAQIFNLKDEIEQYVLEEYIFPTLKKIASDYNLNFEYDEDFYSKSRYTGFVLSPKVPTTWHIWFEFGKGEWKQLYVGVVWDKEQRSTHKAMKRLNIFDYGPNDVWFFGWKNVKNPDWNIDYLLKVANNMADFEMYYREIIGVILDSMKQEGML